MDGLLQVALDHECLFIIQIEVDQIVSQTIYVLDHSYLNENLTAKSIPCSHDLYDQSTHFKFLDSCLEIGSKGVKTQLEIIGIDKALHPVRFGKLGL